MLKETLILIGLCCLSSTARIHAQQEASPFHTVGETNASTATDLATDYKTKNSNNGYCFLGRLTSKAATISVKCTAWFEGTDPNVVNEALNQVVTTTQRFYVRKLAKIK